MDVKTALFYVFAIVLIVSAFKVITSRNPVYSALYLVLAFFQAAAIWVLLEAEFLAITLVLVYVGAVMVLFLFVVMMLDINLDELKKESKKYKFLALCVGAVIALEMAGVLLAGFREPAKVIATAGGVELSNTKELGKLLYTQYLYPLEIAAVILLVAIIAAIALTLRVRKDARHASVPEQLKARKSDRLKVLDIAATRPGVKKETPPDEVKP